MTLWRVDCGPRTRTAPRKMLPPCLRVSLGLQVRRVWRDLLVLLGLTPRCLDRLARRVSPVLWVRVARWALLDLPARRLLSLVPSALRGSLVCRAILALRATLGPLALRVRRANRVRKANQDHRVNLAWGPSRV